MDRLTAAELDRLLEVIVHAERLVLLPRLRPKVVGRPRPIHALPRRRRPGLLLARCRTAKAAWRQVGLAIW